MNDERFDRDLGTVLREIAGEEAPMSLRQRLARITDEAPLGRRLWFAPPMRLATAAVVLVAVVALAIILIPRENVGPTPTASAEPSAPASVSLPSVSLEPSAEPTPQPTAIPTPTLSSWAGIEWTDPFAPFPYQPPVYVGREGTATKLHDLVEWNGEFVGVGSISHGFQCEEAAFFRSGDGVDWAVTDTFSSGDEFISTMCPDHVVATSDGLLAIGQRRMWSSTDGIAWTQIDSPTWRALWTDDMPQLRAVASGVSGVVAIGTDLASGESIVAHSANGEAWQRVVLPANELPIVRDVVAYGGGFVIGGRDGEPDGEASAQHPAVVPGDGRPAVWYSLDGVSWSAAAVEGDHVQGATLTRILVGSHGLFGVGINVPSDWYVAPNYETGDIVTAWASSDGRSWEVVGAFGRDLPPMAMLASDGTNMVGLGLRQESAGQEPTGWASVDGFHWTELAMSGPALEVGYGPYLGPELNGNLPESALWVIDDGLFAMGAGDGVPLNEPYSSQWFRFGIARMR
jgi:hypothetical protein